MNRWLEVLFCLYSSTVVSGNWNRRTSTGDFYYVSTTTAYIGDAGTACTNLGAYLAEINDFAEHQYVTNLLTAPNHYWVGMRYDGTQWVWDRADTAVDPSIPWNAAPNSWDTGIRYNYGSSFGLDGRTSPAYYYYICEATFSTVNVIQPTQTHVLTEILSVPYTVYNTVENYVTQTVENTVIQTVGDTCNAIADNTVTATVAITEIVPNTVVQTVIQTVDGMCSSVSADNKVTETVAITETIASTVIQIVPSIMTQTVAETVTQTVAYAMSSCSAGSGGNTSAFTEEEFQNIIKELEIERTNTSLHRRSLISVSDPRPSAQAIGWVGICFLAIIASGILFADFTRVIKSMRGLCRSKD